MLHGFNWQTLMAGLGAATVVVAAFDRLLWVLTKTVRQFQRLCRSCRRSRSNSRQPERPRMHRKKLRQRQSQRDPIERIANRSIGTKLANGTG
jgi:hypothetical protein